MERRAMAAEGAAVGDIEDLLRPERLAAPAHELPGALLAWYDGARRLLPWRGDPPPPADAQQDGEDAAAGGKARPAVPTVAALDEEQRAAAERARRPVTPYQTWVSEIMLQQTRVDTVVAYFRRWMDAFPTVEALAAASEDEVNARWAGLGYYRRARNLHAGAKKVVDELGGVMPDTVDGLKSLPGIGEYTAGAVASIAFKRAVPLVDGNVIRVFSRLCAVAADAKDKGLAKGCWNLARELVPADRPGDFNQGLMELGATVCSPLAPKCQSCPVQRWCRAYAADPAAVTGFPLKPKKKELPEEAYAVAVMSRERAAPGAAQAGRKRQRAALREYLLVRRPSAGLLAGQWEFVAARLPAAATAPSLAARQGAVDGRLAGAAADADAALPAISPCRACVGAALRQDRGSFTHTFSHLRHHLFVEAIEIAEASGGCAACAGRGAAAAPGKAAWMTEAEMAAVGLTKATKSCLEMAKDAPATAKRRQQRAPRLAKGQQTLAAFVTSATSV